MGESLYIFFIIGRNESTCMKWDLLTLETIAIWAVFGIAIVGLLYAVFLRSQILREDKGTEKMQEVWNAIKDGANAYLQKQLRSILPLIGILTVVVFLRLFTLFRPSPKRTYGSQP